MRFSAAHVLLALPLLATAESPFEQYRAQFQNFLGQFGSFIPGSKTDDVKAKEAAPPPPPEPKAEIVPLTLSNWKQTLYSPVREGATDPEEWWVFVTGNKSCNGHCQKAETAFNETAARFAKLPNPPHMGYVDCDSEKILCTAWSASPGCIWVFDMLPPPAEIDIYGKRLNLSSVTADELVSYQTNVREKFGKVATNWLHPFDGHIARAGLTTVYGYILWPLSMMPNWAFMLIISFISRSFMSRRMNAHAARTEGRQAGAAGAPPAAQ